MKHSRARRVAAVAAALVTGLLATATPALAANPPGVASVAWADFTKAGDQTLIDDLAPCAVDGRTTNTSGPVSDSGVKFGSGSSSCTTTVVDADNDVTTTKSEAIGSNFELSALVAAGGPRLKLASWRITCQADQYGTRAGWGVGGLSGFPALPPVVPANFSLPLKKATGAVLATVTFAEVTLPNPNDGSIDLNLLHVRFQPASGISGELVVGHAACSPTP
ncbi:hypothetical protein [Actinosynnema sp. NPDC020468]|uniref:hypothetical protein n=1 Tax=Actinosynnema sp. NPDC020468 TaxID=3154488 RepID=UPI0033E6C422